MYCTDTESSAFVMCPAPRTPTSGRFEPANQTVWRVGETVTYFCNDNFTLLGSNVSTCLEDGNFDSLVPECVGKSESNIELKQWLIYYCTSQFVNPYYL